MEKQEIRTFGRRHGKKLSQRKQWLMENILPQIAPDSVSGILEIGFGAGEHVRDLARANPDKIIIGAEPFANGVAALLGAICDEETNEILPEYKNIRIWPDDVRDYLRGTDARFAQIWILHPDPWPKARHEKRRLLQTEFIQTVARYLAPGGEIIIGTDHWEYFDWICQRAHESGLAYETPKIDTIKTRYQAKNMAETETPKYIIIKSK
ncbi:MAG: tRNA (guanine(46)-N(7))-methyltransferase TrmB [Alphaproteobacteria bacterium]|nr:tRNA (guanine(46)-N(7))-methyltransferase TrmB [Alphaproteobacteria bacterium]